MAIAHGRGGAVRPRPKLPAPSTSWGSAVDKQLDKMSRDIRDLRTSVTALEKNVAALMGAIQTINEEE